MFNIPSFFGFRAGGSSLLLDLFPGAAAAYSLRLLDSTYLGSAIQVRESTGNTTLDIGFVNGELDTASLLAHCAGANGFVTEWFDQSGNANNATQGNALSQPQIVSSGSVILENSKPTLQFDGIDDFLLTSVAYPTQAHQNTYYVASSTGTNNRVFDTRGAGAAGTLQGWQHKFNNGSDVTSIDSGSIALTLNNIVRTGQKLVSVLMFGGSGSVINEFTNGTSLVSVSIVNSIDFNSGNALCIAANINGQNAQLFGGELQEGVLYNINTSTNRTGIEDNINDFYSIYP